MSLKCIILQNGGSNYLVKAKEKMKKEFIVDGIDSNIDFQLRLIKNKDFEAGTYDNTFLEKFLADSKNDKDNGK